MILLQRNKKDILKAGKKELNFTVICFLVNFILGIGLRVYISKNYHTVSVPDYDAYRYALFAKGFLTGNFDKTAATAATPIYPLLLALFSKFTDLHFFYLGALVNLFFGIATALLIYLFAKKIFNEKVALFSSIIYLLNPFIAFNNILVMSETTYIFFIFLYLVLLSNIFDSPFNIKIALLNGFLGSIIYLARPEGSLVFFFTNLFFIFTSKSELKEKISFVSISFLIFGIGIVPYLYFLKILFGLETISGKSEYILDWLRNSLANPTAKNLFQVYFNDIQKTLSFL